MIEPDPIDQIERFLSYPFKNRDLLGLALTAPGADEANHDGNHSLAREGALVLELVLVHELEGRGLEYGKCLSEQDFAALTICEANVNKAVHAEKNRGVREAIARETGTFQLLRLSPRQAGSSASPATLRNAVNALLGAVFVDSGRNLQPVKDAALRLG